MPPAKFRRTGRRPDDRTLERIEEADDDLRSPANAPGSSAVPSTATSDAAARIDRRRAQLAATLLSRARRSLRRRGRARTARRAARARCADDRHSFQRYLATEFQPDQSGAARSGGDIISPSATAEAAAALARGRRSAAAGAAAADEHGARRHRRAGRDAQAKSLARLRDEPELKLLDADLRHLFASWFNRGFLELRRIDWQSPAAVLEKLIAYEAVHEIKGWDDLRRRLAPDRRCFAFFHPALARRAADLRRGRAGGGAGRRDAAAAAHDGDDEAAARAQAARADTAIFYSISNCQDGLRGVSFGNFLIKQVVEELKAELPQSEALLHPVAGAGISPLVGQAAEHQ